MSQFPGPLCACICDFADCYLLTVSLCLSLLWQHSIGIVDKVHCLNSSMLCLYLLCSLGVDAVVWQCWFCIGSCCPSQVCDTCISPSLFVAGVVLQVPVHSLHHSHLGSVSPCVLPFCKNLDWLRVVWSRWTTGYQGFQFDRQHCII